MNTPFDSRLAERLRVAIEATVRNRQEALGSGTQMIREDAAATGMNCASYMGEIRGLQTALTLLQNTYDEMTGKAKKD